MPGAATGGLSIRTPSYSVIDMRRNPTPLPGIEAHAALVMARSAPGAKAGLVNATARQRWCSVRNGCLLLACALLMVYTSVLVRHTWTRVRLWQRAHVSVGEQGAALEHSRAEPSPQAGAPSAPDSPISDAQDASAAVDEVINEEKLKIALADAIAAADAALDAPPVRAPLAPPQSAPDKREDENEKGSRPAQVVADDARRNVRDASSESLEASLRAMLDVLDAPVPPKRYKAFLFTMDSITAIIRNAAGGGPAGEIIVRESLEWGLARLGVEVVVCTSDADFDVKSRGNMDQYDMFFFDVWTAFGPGWIPRSFIVGRESRTFILSFFGLSEVGHGLSIPRKNILTPFPTTEENTFLGYAIRPRWLPSEAATAAGDAKPLPRKRRQGVLWGKKSEYFAGKEAVLAAVAQLAPLHTTASTRLDFPGLVHHGHLTRDEWHTLLAESKFLLGVGDPLSGPSAMDAVAAGTAFINPLFEFPKENYFMSQHPFLQQYVGAPYVCDMRMEQADTVTACIKAALDTPDLPPRIPEQFTPQAYLQRLEVIMKPFLTGRAA